MSNFLEADPEILHKNLFFQNADGISRPVTSQSQSVVPKPGFCLKTRTDRNEKIFINVCMGDNLPAPKEITDDELLKLLDSEDPSGFRIPMSLGEPHAELDKSGKGCTAYDVVINPSFFESVRTREVLMGFFLTVVLEGLEAKYSISLDRDWRLLKNRKFVGSLAIQNIRTQSKPWIMEVDPPLSENHPGKQNKISEVKSSEAKQQLGKEPPYTILQEPPEGYPQFLVAELHLPEVKTAASLTLDIGEDRVLLTTRSNVYHLDIFLPYYLIQDECVAQFNRKIKMLTITMPVQPAT